MNEPHQNHLSCCRWCRERSFNLNMMTRKEKQEVFVLKKIHLDESRKICQNQTHSSFPHTARSHHTRLHSRSLCFRFHALRNKQKTPNYRREKIPIPPKPEKTIPKKSQQNQFKLPRASSFVRGMEQQASEIPAKISDRIERWIEVTHE
jgi:hypothetical protein